MSQFDALSLAAVAPRELRSTLPGAPAATRTAAARSASTGMAPPAEDDEALATAKAFEKLLIHDLLKTMRRTTSALGEEPSNARTNYDDMLDEQLAGIMSESGGLGFAQRFADTLRQGPGTSATTGSEQASTSATAALERRLGDADSVLAAPPASGAKPTVQGLATADVLRLRALLGSQTPDAADRQASAAASAAALHAPSRLALATSATRPGSGDTRAEQKAFVDSLMPHARRSASRLGTHPDAVLAIAALESDWGRQVIPAGNGLSSHNLFGIKGRPGAANVVQHVTSEYLDGRSQREVAWFRTYQDRGAAVSGFADFLERNPRYSDALGKAGNPQDFLNELQAAGYATDPNYAAKTIKVMERIRALRDSHS